METHARLDPGTLKNLILRSLDDDKALNITDIDLDDQVGLADAIIVASGTSSRQIIAMAQKLRDRLSARGLKGIKVEGLDQGNWVIVDTGDIVVHLFRPEVREFYNIEKMWQMPAYASVTHNGDFQTA